MDKKSVRWLYGEIPQLVRTGVLTPEAAGALRRHYGEPEEGRSGLGLVILASLGGLLIGLGVILLLAHNWEDLGRPARTALSFAPLLLGQSIAGWTILRRPGSVAWREGSAAFLTAAIGASIALVAQTYHISGDLPRFLLTWSVLTLPLIYLLQATLPAMLYLIGLTFWSGMTHDRGEPAWLFWFLAALSVPYLRKVWREAPRGGRFSWLGWVLAICLINAAGSLPGSILELRPVILAGLFSVLYLIDRAAAAGSASSFRCPFAFTGAAGTAILSLFLSFTDAWRHMGGSSSLYTKKVGWTTIHDPLLAVLLLAGALALLAFLLRRGDRGALAWGTAGPLAAAGWLAARAGMPGWTGALVFNIYLLLLGGLTLRSGLKEGRLSTVNGGLAVLSLLIAGRFFDADLPFTLRGILFILIGAAFLGTNLLVSRRGKEAVR